MEGLSLPIYSLEGKEIDTLKLNAQVFDAKINEAAIYQTTTAYLASQRRGLAATKTRGEVSGGGRKPWRQKGTGRARVGSIRSPLWRHGGVIFGPHPRDFSYKIPKKIKRLALKSAIAIKIKENNLMVLDKFAVEEPKTKAAIKVLSNLKTPAKKNNRNQKVLLLLDKIDSNLKRALGNIAFLNFNLAKDTNAYQVLTHRKLIITKDGLHQLTERLKKQ